MNKIIDMLEDFKNLAISKKILISTAESCTGGLISKYLTDLPGSSGFYNSSIIAYSYDSKINLLNVNSNTLLKFGAVSEEVVKEMSLGILKITKSTVVIAISGIMGPGSDTEEVWISIRSKNKERSMHNLLMSGNRDMNREYAAEIAIRELYHFIKEI